MEEDFHDNIDVTHVPRGHDGLVATGTQAPGCSTPSTLQRPQVNGMDADKAEGWAVVQSKKSKRRQNGGDKPQILAGNGAGRSPSSDEAGRSAAGAPEKKQWEGGPRLRLPPLPKDDIKIVLRPRGLAVKDLPQYKVVEAVVAATGRGCKEEDLLVRLRHGSNIIIVSTANEDAAKKVLHIRQINFGGKSFAVNTHAAAPEGTLRGVIHGPAPKTTSEELKAHIRLRTQGVRVITARMLGNSSTALITFDGPTLPKFVIYHSSEYRCHPYRPTRQVCYTCGQQGHRMDVCPNPNAKVCRQCGLQNPTTDHQCTPKCLVCDGDHITGTRDCKQRLKSACELRWGPLQQQRKSRDRSRRRRPRWFRDESQESGRSGSRGRSRNRSRSRGSERDESFPPLGQQQQEQKQGQEQQKKKKTGGVKVSWGDGPPKTLFAPHSNTNTQSTREKQLMEENKALRQELGQLRKQLSEVLKELREIRTGQTQPKTQTPPPPMVEATQPQDGKLEALIMNMQKQTQEQMQFMQQKFALLEQNVRTHIKNQNAQRTTNDARERLYNERRFGAETLNSNPSTPSWQNASNN